MKRQPILADRALAWNPSTPADDVFVNPRLRHILKDKLLEAKRFVLDEEASRYAAEMIRDVPEAIAYGQEFALPPFDNCWIEYRAIPFWNIINYPKVGDAAADEAVGFHIVWPNVYIWSWSSYTGVGYGEPAMLPYRYKMFQPFTLEKELEFCNQVETSRAALDLFFWGESIRKLTEKDLPDAMQFREAEKIFGHLSQVKPERWRLVRSLRAYHSVEMLTKPEWSKRVWSNLYNGAGADLRNIVAFLLFLNRTSKVQIINDVPPAQGWIRSKPRTLTRHSVVRIKLNPLPQLKRLGGHGGAWRRLHDVRSHFCTNKRAKQFEESNPSHLHDWSEMRVNLWRCMHPGCGGLKWWRKSHQRGKKKFGQVETTYEVTE